MSVGTERLKINEQPRPEICTSQQSPASAFYDIEPTADCYCRPASRNRNRHMVASLGRVGLVT